jgi:hypothetical protein
MDGIMGGMCGVLGRGRTRLNGGRWPASHVGVLATKS